MRIAIITPYADPEKGACVIRMDSFRDYFENCGHRVSIFAPERMVLKKNNKGTIRYRGLLGLINTLREGDFDILIGTSPPMFHSFISLIICKVKRIPFILDLRDPWTHAIEKLGLKSQRNPKLKFYKIVEKLTYKYADLIFVVNPFLMKIVFDPVKDREKIVVVSHGANPRLMKRDEKEGKKIREIFRVPEKAPVVAYIGGLGDEELDTFLKTSAEEAMRDYNCHFLFVVAIDETPHSAKLLRGVESTAKAVGIYKNFHLVKNVEYRQIYKYLSASDIGVSSFPEWMDYCLPAKVYDYLACEVPIIAKGAKRGAMQDFFENYDVGHYVSDWSEFNEKFREALENMDEFKKKGKYGRGVVTERFNREMAGEIALKEINKLYTKGNHIKEVCQSR